MPSRVVHSPLMLRADFSNPRDVTESVSRSRREFLRLVTGATGGGASFAFSAKSARAAPRNSSRKMVVVTFGGGCRDEETFMPEGQENIPHLLHELVPQATFFTRVVNRGILGHYVATARLATGVYETFNNFASVPPEHPTVFEYFRKDLKRPPFDAWVVAPSNGFNRIGGSEARPLCPGDAAGVFFPKRVLKGALSLTGAPGFRHLPPDNYGTTTFGPRGKTWSIP